MGAPSSEPAPSQAAPSLQGNAAQLAAVLRQGLAALISLMSEVTSLSSQATRCPVEIAQHPPSKSALPMLLPTLLVQVVGGASSVCSLALDRPASTWTSGSHHPKSSGYSPSDQQGGLHHCTAGNCSRIVAALSSGGDEEMGLMQAGNKAEPLTDCGQTTCPCSVQLSWHGPHGWAV